MPSIPTPGKHTLEYVAPGRDLQVTIRPWDENEIYDPFRPIEHDPDDLPPSDIAENVGRWCEELVFNVLTRTCRGLAKAVTWMNQTEASGAPYDIRIDYENDGSEYIEVKGTTEQDRLWFQVSWNELCVASQEKDKFTIYRVAGALTNNPTVHVVRDPVKEVVEGRLQIVMQRNQ